MSSSINQSDKITCSNCGIKDVPNWNGKGLCITCTRDETLGSINQSELREKVTNLVEYWDFSPQQDEDSRIERVEKQIISIIEAEKQQLLDEIETLTHNGRGTILWEMDAIAEWVKAHRTKTPEQEDA